MLWQMKMPLWIPSAIMVAAIYYAGLRTWYIAAPLFFVLRAATLMVVHVPLVESLLLGLGSVVQATVMAAAGIKVLEGEHKYVTRLSEILKLTAAAMVASGLSWVPWILQNGLVEWERVTRSFIGDTLAVLVISPILYEMLVRYLGKDETRQSLFKPGLALALGGFLIATVFTLSYGGQLVFPFLICAMVYIGVAHGLFGASCAIMIVAIAGMVFSIGGNSPIPAMGVDRDAEGLMLQMWIAGMVAMALPISSMLVRHDLLEQRLLERNESLHESLSVFGLAEQVAGLGRWRFDLRNGTQEWSPLMLDIHGLPRDLGADPGDIRQMLPDGGDQFYGQIESNAARRDPYSFTYRIKPPDGPERIVRLSALNEFGSDDRRQAIFAVAMDVTEQVRREEALDLARGRAVQLAAEAQKIANTDALTGLPNRRCTFERLEAMLSNAVRKKIALAVVMFDIDHFKRINDTFGHQTGDEVIVGVSDIARKLTRQGDLVGRIGGEEFVWLLPHVPADVARQQAERLRQGVEDGTKSAPIPEVTISAGFAMFRPGDTAESLLARADEALYEAKEGGRNLVRRVA